MGLECPCGVLVNALSRNNHVRFHGHKGTTKGDLTYMANVCVSMLGASSLSLKFVETDSKVGMKSFLFVAKTFSSAVCRKKGEGCEVTITGTGTVNGVLYPFEVVFIEQKTSPYVDVVQSFVIDMFFTQYGPAQISQGSIIVLGCDDCD